jgi:hypothetical protein
LLILQQGLEFLEVILIKDDSTVTVGFEVDANVIMFGFLMQILNSSCCEDWLHAKGLFEVFGRRVVCVVGLNEPDGWGCRYVDKQVLTAV